MWTHLFSSTQQELLKFKRLLLRIQKHPGQYENEKIEDNEIIYSMDLKKVIIFPRCDMFKSVVFIHRLSVYNESFVPVGKNNKRQIVACLWHGGISGRLKDDIESTIYKFRTTVARYMKKISLWMDNCSAQN